MDNLKTSALFYEKAHNILTDALFAIEHMQDEVRRPTIAQYENLVQHLYNQIIMAKSSFRDSEFIAIQEKD